MNGPVAFRLYYATGQVYEGRPSPEEWNRAPETGVLALAVIYPGDKRAVYTSHDWYCYDGEMFSVTGYGWHEHGPPPPSARRGEWAQDRTMEYARKRAVSDPWP